MYTLESMRKWSDHHTSQFLEKSESYIYLCEKMLPPKINDQQGRLQLLQMALTMKQHLEGIHRIVQANTALALAKSTHFSYSENGQLKFIDPAEKQALVSAAKQAQDQAYCSYLKPTFLIRRSIQPPRATGREEIKKTACSDRPRAF